MAPEQPTIAERLQAVEARLDRALQRCGRNRPDITLVAVSKKFSAACIRAAYDAGLREFGENYVQEFSTKNSELTGMPGARYHLIGHLQSNKARLACELFQVVQTADSAKILERLNAFAGGNGAALEVLLEIKLSDESSKTGALPENVPKLLEAAQSLGNLRVTGLMTMPPWSENPEDSRLYFRKLAQVARDNGLAKLSMGMSGDFEVAIEEGATIIRVGTALFGSRPKPAAEDLLAS